MRVSKIFDSAQCEVAIFMPANVSPELRICYGSCSEVLSMARGMGNVAACTIHYPVDTTELGSNTVPQAVLNAAIGARQFVLEYQIKNLGNDGFTMRAVNEIASGIEDSLSNVFAFNALSGFEYDGKLLIGRRNMFEICFKDSQNKPISIWLTSGFVKRVSGDTFLSGLSWSDELNSFQGLFKQYQLKGSYIEMERDLDSLGLANHFYIDLLNQTFPGGVVTAIASGFIVSNCSTSERGKYNSGIEVYTLSSSNEWVLKQRVSFADASRLVAEAGERGAKALNAIAANGSASTGLAIACETIADSVPILAKSPLASVEYGKSEMRAQVRILSKIGSSLNSEQIKTEDELNEALQYVSLASQSGKGAQIVVVDAQFRAAAMRAIALSASNLGRVEKMLVDGLVVQSYPSVFSQPPAELLALDDSENDNIYDTTITSTKVSFNDLTNEEGITLAEFKKEMKAMLVECERLRDELTQQLTATDISYINRNLQLAREKMELSHNSFVKSLAAQQQVAAAAKAVLDEIAKILKIPVVFGPYAREFGVVGDFITLNWNGSSSTAVFDNERMLNYMRAQRVGASSTRIKASWTVYDYMKGDSPSYSPWARKETQMFDVPFDPTKTKHGSDTLRFGPTQLSYLAPYGAHIPSTIHVVVSEGSSRKSGCSVVQVTPRVTYSYIGLPREAGMTSIATALQNLMRSDALAAVATAGKLVANQQRAISSLAKEVTLYANMAADVVERQAQLGRVNAQIQTLQGLSAFNGSESTNSAISSSSDEPSLWIEGEGPQALQSRTMASHGPLFASAIKFARNLGDAGAAYDALTAVSQLQAQARKLLESESEEESSEDAREENLLLRAVQVLAEVPSNIHQLADAVLGEEPTAPEAPGEGASEEEQQQYESLLENYEVAHEAWELRKKQKEEAESQREQAREARATVTAMIEGEEFAALRAAFDENRERVLEAHEALNGIVWPVDADIVNCATQASEALKQVKAVLDSLQRSRQKLAVTYTQLMNGRSITIHDTLTISIDKTTKQIACNYHDLEGKAVDEQAHNLWLEEFKDAIPDDTENCIYKGLVLKLQGYECKFLCRLEKKTTSPDGEAVSYQNLLISLALIDFARTVDSEVLQTTVPLLGFSTSLKGLIRLLTRLGFGASSHAHVLARLGRALGFTNSRELRLFIEEGESTLLTDLELATLKGLIRTALDIDESATDGLVDSKVLSVLGFYALDNTGLGELYLQNTVSNQRNLHDYTQNVSADLLLLDNL